jgi:hypothetical protein
VEAEDGMKLDRVRRYTCLTVLEVEEGNSGDLGSPAESGE